MVTVICSIKYVSVGPDRVQVLISNFTLCFNGPTGLIGQCVGGQYGLDSMHANDDTKNALMRLSAAASASVH